MRRTFRVGTIGSVSDDWRPLRLRRAGTCVDCAADLPAGVEALWSRAAGTVRCLSHPAAEGPTSPSTAAAGQQAPASRPAAGDWRELRLRRPSRCSVCAADLPAGSAAQWSASQKTTRCLSHDGTTTVADEAPEPVAVAPVGPRVTGTAGGSAQAEYERRKARREQKVRNAHPIMGGLILALSDEPQHVRAWKQGADGERAVARRLDRLTENGVEVMHDRRIPRTRANIDHVAVSSSGVYVIDAKNYTGLVKVDWQGGLFSPRTYTLKVGRRDATKLVTGVQWQVDLVRKALAGAPGLPPEVPVTGVLAFFDADWPFFPPEEIDGVRLEGPKSAGKFVLRAGPYSIGQVAAIAERLRTRFPEA